MIKSSFYANCASQPNLVLASSGYRILIILIRVFGLISEVFDGFLFEQGDKLFSKDFRLLSTHPFTLRLVSNCLLFVLKIKTRFMSLPKYVENNYRTL